MKSRLEYARGPYRSLLKTGRTYAGFNEKSTIPLIENLIHHKTIADPMAGFGGLMKMCSTKGVRTVNIEYNPPSYLWIVATNPKNAPLMINILSDIEKYKVIPPSIGKAAGISSSWFSNESKEIIACLYGSISKIARNHVEDSRSEEISLAILLPFVGRLSSFVPGNTVTHVKEGGICIYKGLSEDFCKYIKTFKKQIELIIKKSNQFDHEVIHGDLRIIKQAHKVSAFITSPPYPNGRDYHKMFAPENNCLVFMKANKLINGFEANKELIGSPVVSGYIAKGVDYLKDISSESARKFIEYIGNCKYSKKAKYDNQVYYVPYFGNYFYQLEKAYENFVNFLDDRCEGYVVAVNNTARDKVVPVAEAIVDTFTSLGFEAKICDKYTTEQYHFGSINPRAKGFKAKHMEYKIKISRKVAA